MHVTRGQWLALSHVSDLSQIHMSGKSSRQLIHLAHEEWFTALLQHRSLLLVHHLHVALEFAVVFVVKPSLATVSLGSRGLRVLPLAPTSLSDGATFFEVRSSSSATFPVTVLDASRASASVATLWHPPLRLSALPTRNTVCRGSRSTRASCPDVVNVHGCLSWCLSLGLYLLDFPCQLWSRLALCQRNIEHLSQVSQLGLVLLTQVGVDIHTVVLV